MSQAVTLPTKISGHVNLRQRKYYAHAAHGSVGVALNRTLPRDDSAWDSAMSEPEQRLPRVCVVATPVGDDADRALDTLLAKIAEQLPHDVGRAWSLTEDMEPTFVALQQADVAVICGRRMPLAGEALGRMQWYCQRGRPLVVLRAGIGPTFARWPQFDSSVLGVEGAGSVAAGIGPMLVRPGVRPHPIIAGIGAFESGGSLPHGIDLTNDAEVLLEGPGGDVLQPLAWTRHRGSARVFATALGQPGDLVAPAFARLVGNAIRWVTRA